MGYLNFYKVTTTQFVKSKLGVLCFPFKHLGLLPLSRSRIGICENFTTMIIFYKNIRFLDSFNSHQSGIFPILYSPLGTKVLLRQSAATS